MRTSIHSSAALLVLGGPMLALAQRGLVAPGPKVGIADNGGLGIGVGNHTY